MSGLTSYVEALIAEITRVQALDFMSDIDEGEFSFPGQIAAGDDRFIMTTREMERLIELSARELKRSNLLISRIHTDREWIWMVRSAFGPALMLIDLEGDPQANARTIVSEVCLAVNEYIESYDHAEHVLGCTLFSNFEVPHFSIGPVHFEPRAAWLSRNFSEGKVNKITARRVARAWSGQKLRNRKPTRESIKERHILDVIQNSTYVCSVWTEGLAAEAGRLKAQTAARLAMTGIALRWANSSRALDGFKLQVDQPSRRQPSITFTSNKRIIFGSNLKGMPHGPYINAERWANLLSEYQKFFQIVGEAIAYYLSADGKAPRSKLMNTFAQALLWFHEGCKEEIHLIALVKFSACLDTLASGGKSNGIRSMIKARLGVPSDKPIRKDGLTMHEAVDEIYSLGRSRTIHGTNDKIGNDWSSTRELAEHLARLCLLTCLEWAADNPENSDPLALKR
ncbi:hypothetical protein [Xaviernesmea oryzae]|uniref:hypothetical protein n=1 Tax=Xaviernesmea oryzae TaxID=464029 RepID=UPI0008C52D39|nr:hypothetical protein [Xaviernesmea oryzae]SEM19113.1 hypothetical protein SAMN04487976_12215 [Xaviernesmea oryzae]